jgi:hypothetical protein
MPLGDLLIAIRRVSKLERRFVLRDMQTDCPVRVERTNSRSVAVGKTPGVHYRTIEWRNGPAVSSHSTANTCVLLDASHGCVMPGFNYLRSTTSGE